MKSPDNRYFDPAMKQFLLFSTLFVLIFVDLSAQIMFQQVYGGQSYDYGKEVIQTPDDGYLIAGATGSFGLESAQVMVIKTDPDGYVEWRRYYGGPLADQAESMELSADGNLIIGGYTERTGKSYQMYALKLTMDGDTIWSNHYGGELWDFARKVIPLADGGYALFGQTYSYGQGNGDFYLVRLNSEGDTLWTRTYGGPELESGESMALTSDGGFLLAGYTESFGAGEKDVYVVRTDMNGDTLWTMTYGGPEDDYGYAVVATSDGGFAVVGGTFNNTPGEADFMNVKFDADGNPEWERLKDGSADEYWYDAIEDDAGNIVVAGYVEDSGFGKEDVRIERVSPNGVWNNIGQTHGSTEDDRAFDLKQTSDGCYVMVGHTGGFLNRFDDVYLIKMNCAGQTSPTELGVNEILIDDVSFAVSIGPNPFRENPTFFIQGYGDLVSKLKGPLSFRLFNALGQTLFETEINSSDTDLHLNLPAGVYSYQLVNNRAVMATGVAIGLN